MKNHKICIFTMVLLVSMMFCIPAYSAEMPIEVYIDEVPVNFDVSPVIDDGRVLVPMRAIFEAFNANIEWDDKTQTITASTEYMMCLELQVGNSAVKKYFLTPSDDYDFENNTGTFIQEQIQELWLDVPPKVINGRTMVPLRFIGEAMGYDVKWDNESKKVNIDTFSEVGSAENIVDQYEPIENEHENIIDIEALNQFSIGDSVLQNTFLFMRFGTIKDVDYTSGQVSVTWEKVTDAAGNEITGGQGMILGLYDTEWVDPSTLDIL